VYAQMHARVRRICGDSHELALRNVQITITITRSQRYVNTDKSEDLSVRTMTSVIDLSIAESIEHALHH
jgi:hypothetical protein